MRAVNLLPRDETTRRRRTPSGPLVPLVLLPVVVAVLIGGAFVLQQGSVASKREQLDALERELATMPAPEPVDPAHLALAQEKGSRIAALAEVIGQRIAFDRVFRELSLVLPEDVWLTSLAARSPTAIAELSGEPLPPPVATPPPAEGETTTPAETPAPAPQEPELPTSSDSAGFVLTGYTYSQEGVARLLARLAVVPHLANVKLERSSLVPVAKRSVVQFTILADLRGGGPAA